MITWLLESKIQVSENRFDGLSGLSHINAEFLAHHFSVVADVQGKQKAGLFLDLSEATQSVHQSTSLDFR